MEKIDPEYVSLKRSKSITLKKCYKKTKFAKWYRKCALKNNTGRIFY